MSNELPESPSSLTDLAADMIDGLEEHGTRVGVKQWTGDAITSRLTAYTSAKTAHDDAGKAEDAITSARKIANSNAKGFIATAKRVLIELLGPQPGKKWEDVGWPAGTTEAPTTIEDRKKLLGKLVPWLSPDKEIPLLGFTKAKGTAILAALTDAIRDLSPKVADRVKASAVAATAERALRTGMSGLTGELGSILPDDSADWYYFGLVPPAKAEPPAPPEHLEARAISPTALVAGCDRGPRAAKTVFLIQVLGRDPAPIAQEPKRDPEITIEGLPPGATVKITAKSTNAAGSSAIAGPVEVKLG